MTKDTYNEVTQSRIWEWQYCRAWNLRSCGAQYSFDDPLIVTAKDWFGLGVLCCRERLVCVIAWWVKACMTIREVVLLLFLWWHLPFCWNIFSLLISVLLAKAGITRGVYYSHASMLMWIGHWFHGTVCSKSHCARTKVVGSDVHERLYRSEPALTFIYMCYIPLRTNYIKYDRKNIQSSATLNL
jgi:hypothetical protein